MACKGLRWVLKKEELKVVGWIKLFKDKLQWLGSVNILYNR
jgi:hypothetical protein